MAVHVEHGGGARARPPGKGRLADVVQPDRVHDLPDEITVGVGDSCPRWLADDRSLTGPCRSGRTLSRKFVDCTLTGRTPFLWSMRSLTFSILSVPSIGTNLVGVHQALLSQTQRPPETLKDHLETHN